MNDASLRTSLLDLWQTLGPTAYQMLLGGGYGLYLKQLHLTATGQRTLVSASLWPAPRATQDLDLLLSADIVADAAEMQAIRNALDRLGYMAVKGSEYLQFIRHISRTQIVKIDLLTDQLDVLQENAAIQADERRARPASRRHPPIHAHPTDGALALHESPLVMEVAGKLSTGKTAVVQIKIPHPFGYLLMKLTAYRDRRGDTRKDLGRYHALDVFRIVAMMTEQENAEVRRYIQRFAANAQVQSCTELVRTAFAGASAAGVLAMREHPLWHNDDELTVFIEIINELFA